jgi:hypothetical protein
MELLMRARVRSALAATVLIAIGLAHPAAQVASVDEGDIKAAFLYNFTKYIEWPHGALDAGEFRICVMGEGTFVTNLEGIIAGESIDGHPVAVRRPTSAEEARSCHILFLEDFEPERAHALIGSLKHAAILTVGDTPDFLASGGMIGFVREGGRMRFDVDTAAAQRAGLSVSSRLLRVARRVGPEQSRQ